MERLPPTDPSAARLSFLRSDPERGLGLPAGPFTQPGTTLPMLLAMLITGLVYGGLWFFGEGTWLRTSLLREDSWYISALIVFLSALALSILMVKRAKILVQSRALRLPVVPQRGDWVLSVDTVDEVLARLWDLSDDPGRFVLLNRIQVGLSNLRNMGRVGDLGDVLRYQAESDEAGVESSYGVVRGLIWGIPVLGFIGTVIGLSAAVGAFANTLGNAQSVQEITQELRPVIGGLSTAFETTLQALIAALVLQQFLVVVRRQEERMLDQFTEFCQRWLLGRVRLRQWTERQSGPSDQNSASAPSEAPPNGSVAKTADSRAQASNQASNEPRLWA
jgi:hypothetical protein